MFRIYSPGALLFSLIVAGLLSLVKTNKKARRYVAPPTPQPYTDHVNNVVDAHADCTAEVFNIFVSGSRKVRIFSELIPGDRVELCIRDDEVVVCVKGKYMATPLLPDTSRLRELLEADVEIEAFLGGRDVTSCTEEAEFCSIIAFYKIEGVAPTKVRVV